MKDEQRASANAIKAEAEVLAKIAEMPDADRMIAERLHALIKQVAPMLASDLVRDACLRQRRQRRMFLRRLT